VDLNIFGIYSKSRALFSYLPPETAWRWMFAIGALPAVLVFFLRRYVEEPVIAAETRAKQAASAPRCGRFSLVRFSRPLFWHR
jgi:MFS family permease